MREIIWIYVAALILLLFDTLNAESALSETNQSTSLNSSSSPIPMHVKNVTFNLGSDANLTCSNKTWAETVYVIWKINLTNNKQSCKIGLNSEGQGDDTCKDGKSLRNTSRAQSYLHIPNFSGSDVGIYECEFIFKGGSEIYMINVDIIVPPSISAWLEEKKTVAVCKAERGKPAANISWLHVGNIVAPDFTQTEMDSNGFFTVESHLKLLGEMDAENLSCAVNHLYWREERFAVPQLEKGYVSWKASLIVVLILVFLAGILLFPLKKLLMRRNPQSMASPAKSAPMEDVEEVEPYASYIQRVNSIYKSSADLFT